MKVQMLSNLFYLLGSINKIANGSLTEPVTNVCQENYSWSLPVCIALS